MARNIDIDRLIFPVKEQDVFLSGQSKSIPGLKAIVGNLGNGFNTTFSVVSENYQLITNEQALEMGKQIHLKLFPEANASSFEIFNIIAPSTKSYCLIDIIDKNYTFNIGKNETYVPFIRIHNSYNRSRSLKFYIGFCRKFCENGTIYEHSGIELNFAHTKQSFKADYISKIDVSHLKKFEKEFKEKTSQSLKIPIERKYFLPLAAKVLGKTFNLSGTNPDKKKLIEEKQNLFKTQIDQYSDRYINKESLDETAYAFFNVITDYSTNSENLQTNSINGLQSKCGLWVNQVGELVTKPGFSWDKEIAGYEYLLK